MGQAVGTEFGYQPNEFGGVYVAGAGPIVWGAGDIRAPSCDGDDGARQISNASVVLNFRGCAYTIDSADAEFLSPSGSAWERLYENGLVLNGQGTFGQALWGGGPTDEEPWDRGWYVADLTTCGLPATESMPWDAYVCELANTGYERSRTVNADGQFIVNKDHRAYLYTISEPTSLATAFLLLAILIVLRRNTPLTPA